MDSEDKSMAEYAIIPIGRPSGEKEFKHQSGTGPFGGDTRAGRVFGDAPKKEENRAKTVEGVVVEDSKKENGGGRPDDKRGVENKTINVFDIDTGTYKDIPESDFDSDKHMKDVVDGEVVEAEDGEEEKMSKDEFLELVIDARISNSEYNRGGENKTKRDTARQKLRDEEVNVDYITCRDLPGSTQDAKNRRSERNDEIDSLMEAVGIGKVTAEQKAKLLSEDIGLTQERLDEWGVDEGVVVVELNEKQKREKLISDNEDLYRELFFADFDQNAWLQGKDRIRDLWNSFHGEEILHEIVKNGFQYKNTPEGNFALLREAYLQHIFGEEVLSGLNDAKEDLDKTIATSKSTNSRDKTVAENLLRTQRPRVENLIRGRTLGVGNSRGWPSIYSGLAADYMLEYFGLKEKGGGSDYDVIVKLFKTKYLLNKVDLDPVEIQKMNLGTETMKTIQAVEKVHNWTKALEGAASFEKLNTTEMSGIDEAIKTVFNINGGEMIAKVMEIYITEMVNQSKTDETIGVDIDNAIVLSKVLQGMDSQTFKTDEEKTLYATMARDLIRVTGMDAQFFMPRNGIEDKDKPLKLIKGGSFLAGAINFEEKTKKKYAEDKGLLVNGLDFGLTPFFRTLWKQSDTKCEGFSAADIVNTFNLKFVGTEYTSWVNSFDGIVNLQKGEEDFIRNPVLKVFIETVIPLYIKAKKDTGNINNRLKQVISYFLKSNRSNRVDIGHLMKDILSKDKMFNGLGLFKDTNEATQFFSEIDISVDLSSIDSSQGFNRGKNSADNFDLFGWLKKK